MPGISKLNLLESMHGLSGDLLRENRGRAERGDGICLSDLAVIGLKALYGQVSIVVYGIAYARYRIIHTYLREYTQVNT